MTSKSNKFAISIKQIQIILKNLCTKYGKNETRKEKKVQEDPVSNSVKEILQ